MIPLRQALSRVFTSNRPASTLGELELLGAVTTPKAWYRLHLINAFVEPAKHRWTKYLKMSLPQARYWRDYSTKHGGVWVAYLEKFVNEEGWVEV